MILTLRRIQDLKMKTMMVILKSKEKVHFEVREEGQTQNQIQGQRDSARAVSPGPLHV